MISQISGTLVTRELDRVDVATAGGVTVGPCWEKCIAMGCDGATDALLPFVQCISNMCQAECAAGTCQDCALAKCGTQVGACLGQTCAP